MPKNKPLSGIHSPTELNIPLNLPTEARLSRYSLSALRWLAKRLSESYRNLLSINSNECRQSVLSHPLPYGIELRRTSGSTSTSLVTRLVDQKWWTKKLITAANAIREHQAQLAGKLGGKSPTQICCTDASLAAYRERKESSDKILKSQFKMKISGDGTANVFSLYDIAEAAKKNRLNEIFLDIKALEYIAESKGYGCAFITLTAAPHFHSNPKRGQNTYSGATAREANNALLKDWRSVLDSLDNLGVSRKGGHYFGFRVVELHEDGCPHWHILFFFDQTMGIIQAVENSIRRRYTERCAYFEGQKDSIIKIIEKSDSDTAMPSSYIFKYLAFALSGDSSSHDSDALALRYKCAISAMGARQYSFFGIKCAVSKQRALKTIARSGSAPHHIKTLAEALHAPKSAEGRNASQLKARVDFFEGAADKLEIFKMSKRNRFGEMVDAVHSIKHDDDVEAVQISGLCVDITPDEAEGIQNGQELADEVYERAIEREHLLVTIVDNYSREAKA